MTAPSMKQYIFWKGKAMRMPVSGTFELTPRCNLDCKMCYIHMTPKEQRNFGTELTTQQWLDIGKQAVEAGMVYLLITGGEPFLRTDFVTIYEALVKQGVKISINTNGICTTPEIVECFRRFPPDVVNITLYGSSSCTYGNLCGVTDGFQRTIDNIRMLKNAGVHVSLNTTFTKLNIADMESVVAFAKAEQLPIRTAAYVFPPVRNGHTPDEDVCLSPAGMGYQCARFDEMTMPPERRQKHMELLQKLEQNENLPDERRKSTQATCMAGRGAFWICWDGKMYPCGLLPDDGINVTEMPFADAWTETCRRMEEVRLPVECSSCKYQPVCPTCAAVSLCITGRTDRVPEYICTRTHAYVNYFLKK